MNKPKYKGIAAHADTLGKEIKAIDNLITSHLVVDMLRGTAAMDSYLWIYYSKDDKLMQGFCIMLRQWINFQRAWKKGELLRMIEEGQYSFIGENELSELCEQKKFPVELKDRISPTPLKPERLSQSGNEEQKKQYLEEYVNSRYCPWPDAAPILVLCIGTDGSALASVEQTIRPSRLNFQAYE